MIHVHGMDGRYARHQHQLSLFIICGEVGGGWGGLNRVVRLPDACGPIHRRVGRFRQIRGILRGEAIKLSRVWSDRRQMGMGMG